MDDVLAQFTSITSADPERASQYLRVTDNNLEQAIQLYFESDGVDMGGSLNPSAASAAPAPTAAAAKAHPPPINLDTDDEEGRERPPHDMDNDEAMARRLQDEMYGSSGPNREIVDQEDVRAPMGRTTETLLGPGADWREDPDEMRAAIAEQMVARQQRRIIAQRPGIFNQQGPPSASIWENGQEDLDARRRHLSRATGGASDASSKTSMLAEMFRPPFELISPLRSWEGVRAAGKEEEKWILINVQDPNIFDCQVLNRDIWKDDQIKETVRENFIFKQYNKTDPQGANYVRYYFQAADNEDSYPHIAIVDPRTGEQVKVWSGVPAPKAPEFLMQLHEFLDRYSLKEFSKNPVATRKLEKKKEKDPEMMTEEEQMEMAMQKSLGGTNNVKDDDPDSLTRPADAKGKERARYTAEDQALSDGIVNDQRQGGGKALFASISSNSPHVEPPMGTPDTARIQFRHQGGRVVRRFSTSDPVRRIFEWMKAEPLEGKQDSPFELVSMSKNLIDSLDSTIDEAGLKNGTVMVEFAAG